MRDFFLPQLSAVNKFREPGNSMDMKETRFDHCYLFVKDDAKIFTCCLHWGEKGPGFGTATVLIGNGEKMEQ